MPERRPGLVIEAVCCSLDDCLEAEAGGADRVELCSAIELGGLTPSLGTLMEVKARTRLPVMVMIRARAGGFDYTGAELAVMRRDALVALGHGADGIVVGVLRTSGEIDLERCAELVGMARAAGREAVFHRAFDAVPDPFQALEVLIGLGVTRILTSGRQTSALAGASLIAELVRRADGRIQILPGGGVRETNIAALLQATGVRQVHLAPFTARPDLSLQANPALDSAFGAARLTDAAVLRRLRDAATKAQPGQPDN
jgi:copper homeostasis protein